MRVAGPVRLNIARRRYLLRVTALSGRHVSKRNRPGCKKLRLPRCSPPYPRGKLPGSRAILPRYIFATSNVNGPDRSEAKGQRAKPRQATAKGRSALREILFIAT